ncbi:MAG: hypothetical protein NUW01_15720 [Gemmatimonadaceae bacterium]|nr:hypothetical protein [Gemmatimonadaceae bacterium]
MSDEYRLVLVPEVEDGSRRVVLWMPDGRALRRTAGFHGEERAMKGPMPKGMPPKMAPKGAPKGGKHGGGGKRGC